MLRLLYEMQLVFFSRALWLRVMTNRLCENNIKDKNSTLLQADDLNDSQDQ